MKVGDLVKCNECACRKVEGGVGIVIQRVKYEMAKELSIHVQWPGEDLWYEDKELEVIRDSR